MIISTWNIIGLNQPLKKKELRLFMKKNMVDVMGVVETRVKVHKAGNTLQKMGPGELLVIMDYGNVEAKFLNLGVSDHSPILIQEVEWSGGTCSQTEIQNKNWTVGGEEPALVEEKSSPSSPALWVQ
ncbi:hypothetical protein RDI58_029013 [Solanum bulbocastanum]|uniref:Uncharacterized protein n=1 Tax=Solanum bulbocastanum TaxID=147425 RepID=A0AAN8SSX8_SOLBU